MRFCHVVVFVYGLCIVLSKNPRHEIKCWYIDVPKSYCESIRASRGGNLPTMVMNRGNTYNLSSHASSKPHNKWGALVAGGPKPPPMPWRRRRRKMRFKDDYVAEVDTASELLLGFGLSEPPDVSLQPLGYSIQELYRTTRISMMT